MTSQSIKFYKFSNSTTSANKIASAKAVEGAIIFLVDKKELWIGGSSAANAKLVLRGTNEVTYDNNVLTITTWDNAGATSTKTLDFSDVASADATLKVFEKMFNLMGTTNVGGTQTIDYSNTNYLSTLGQTGQPDKNLINADKALDTAIYNNSLMGADSAAVYDTEHLSTTWTDVVEANAVEAADTVKAGVEKVDKKVAQLANEVIHNEEVTQQAFAAVANSVGLGQDFSLDLSSASSTGAIHNDTDVKSALIHLDNAINTNKLDVQVGGTSIVNDNVANIITEGTYNSGSNKIATQSTVSDAINALDVNTDTGAASISGSAITINAVKQENGKIKDGGSTTINLDGTYDATNNKIATKSTVTTAIEALDATNIQGVDYTAADASNGAKLTFKGVSETNAVIAQGTGDTILQFAKVATSGAAADVSYTNSTSGMTATNVQAAIDELDGRVDSLVGGMRYNGGISSATATLNTTTRDIRPGDIYLASGAFTIGTTSVEAGDMIVYKGTASSSEVDLNNDNCTIIERETDTMVTAGNTLEDDYIVFGNGNKEVTTTSTVDSANYTVSAATLKDAITKANSALQSISKGTDSTYVTTTIGTKDSNNNQTVAVSVKQATVTYTPSADTADPDLSVATGDEGILTDSAITPIKGYIDDKVANVVSDLDVPEYQQASVEVDTANHVSTLKIKGIQETDGKIAAATTTPTSDVAIDGEYNASSNKIATKSTVTNAINTLNADITSNNNAVATVEVVETNGKITNVVVTNVSAGVTYTRSEQAGGSTGASADLAAGSSAAAQAGAVTGADIAAIKSYVDDKAILCWEEYDQ